MGMMLRRGRERAEVKKAAKKTKKSEQPQVNETAHSKPKLTRTKATSNEE